MWKRLFGGVWRAARWIRDRWESIYLRIPPRGRKFVGLAMLGLLVLYYPVGMVLTHRIDDNPDFRPDQLIEIPGGSHAVAVMAGLIEREVMEHEWVANDPFFKPAALLDNMPNFQQGMLSAFARFAIELRDQIGRTRGSSTTDPALDLAAGLLPYPGDIWIFDFATSLLPTASSERQYIRARAALLAYNGRLASGEAVFERRADNLLATLDRIALDIGASSAALDAHVREHASDWFDFEADDLFYTVKGQIYAYYMILKALKEDYLTIIQNREILSSYDQMLASMRSLALLDPLVVTNNSPDGQIIPNHLLAQGFYLLRARTQLREITNILQK